MMDRRKTLRATADIAKNRLYITIAGQVSKEDLDRLYTDVRFCVADLRPGFDVVNDLLECPFAALNGIPTFKKIANYLTHNKVGRVVRVIRERNIVFKQIVRVSAGLDGYKAIYVNTLEEADAELDKS